jgi:hypothetical protein
MGRVAYLAIAVAVLAFATSPTAIAETRSTSPSLPFRIYAVPLVADQTR